MTNVPTALPRCPSSDVDAGGGTNGGAGGTARASVGAPRLPDDLRSCIDQFTSDGVWVQESPGVGHRRTTRSGRVRWFREGDADCAVNRPNQPDFT
jgi:hypothetical protein